jgi:fibronectin-binding autotransporter adhesin
MKNTYGHSHARQARNRWTSLLAIGASLAIVAGVALTTAGSASALTLSPKVSTLPCTVTVSGGGQLAPSAPLITGVVAGTTQIKFDCNASSGAAVAAEASLLAAISSSNVIPTSEADTTSLGTFTASATDTGCPTGTAGSCTVATFAVPATFTASGDTNSVCPPTQAQINAGLFGCAVAVANSSEAEIAGGEYLLQYASQPTPAAPTISAMQTTGSAGSLINVSDAAGATGYWWGDAAEAVQALEAGTTAAVAPSTCTTGYGDVPTADLVEAWYTAGSSTPTFAGPATGVTISNDCYTGSTLTPPALGGTLTVPATVTAGTAYTVYLCEVNATPYPSNDANSAKVCGTAAPFIDASFTFNATAKALSQNLPVAATVATTAESAFTAQLTSSGNTGTVTYTQTAGSPGVVVSGSGAVTTSGTLTAGTYTASGTTADPNGDSGTFTFKLNVTGSVVTKTPPPKATRVVGWGIIGRTDIVTITGKDFTAGPKIIGHAGTVATVVRATASRITVRVRVVKSARKGAYRFTIQFRSGKKTSVVYTIR